MQNIQTPQNDDIQDKDMFVINLEKKITALQSCQNEHNLYSCMPCAEFIGCAKRTEYVKAVYDSMSKGQDGDFDFN